MFKLNHNWPEYFPESCPPKHATREILDVYRICQDNPPSANDFIPYAILYPDKTFIGQECQSCGISVFRDKKDAINLIKTHKSLKKAYIAKGTITPESGVIAHTPNDNRSHVTWWVNTHFEPNSVFHPQKEG